MKKARILLVEDDENLGSLLSEYLNAKNYETDWESNGVRGYNAFMKNQYDICILDVMMPKKDGFSLASDIRLLNSEIPVIFLTAKSMKEDVLQGFNVGADDYMKKPFSMDELLARVEAVLRRTRKTKTEVEQTKFQIGRFLFDTNKRTLEKNGEITKITTKESELLRLLCINTNKVLERNFALKSIWKDDTYFNARSMDVYITKLRKLLKDEKDIEIINVHGEGYKLIM